MICPLCKNRELNYLFSANDYISFDFFDIYICQKCDLAATKLTFEYNNMLRYYSFEYYGKRKFVTESIINYIRIKRVCQLAISSSAHSLLDVGCGNGTFFLSLRRIGWLSFGTEIAPPEHLKNDANKFVYHGDFQSNTYTDNSFDIITMWHSLEHVEDPLTYFIHAKRILKKNGILLIEVPNFQSWQSRIFKTNWFHLDVPRHTFHFSPKSISTLFTNSGFNNILIRNGDWIYTFFGCLQSALNVFSKKGNLLFDFLNNKISFTKVYTNHRKDLFITVLCFVPALVFAFILFLVERIFRKSGIILVYARKIT